MWPLSLSHSKLEHLQPQYEILDRIGSGSGSNSDVYRGDDLIVSLKWIHDYQSEIKIFKWLRGVDACHKNSIDPSSRSQAGEFVDFKRWCSQFGGFWSVVAFGMERFIQPYCSVGLPISKELCPLSNWHVKSCVPFEEFPACKSLETKSNQSGLNLDGEISPAIGDLKDLLSIDLKGNQLLGQIPDEIGDCSSLKSLFQHTDSRDLAQNKLSGEIPRLIYWNEVLQYLGLRGNNLVGALSPDMCQLTGLCDVSNNSPTGSIPQNIGNCTGFQVLDLSYNLLTREIPFNIGFLQVAALSLQGNQLSGKIPSVIGLMQALAVLELNDNHLCGHIPPELGKLTDLFDLHVANNNLEGPIPDNLSSCTNLNSLNVEGNKLNGSIPYAFERLENMTYL
ncbi:hypothetical protein HHK36_030310 [Tetracentron sinense]|uniref:Uncharacterized protein n=1 Tax=Tetracentron sinense TaxID=13715 RepID=A0A834Y9F1_TETSI|nr:hypothetical protein HHK36_030310 [Tetracentron sinense]